MNMYRKGSRAGMDLAHLWKLSIASITINIVVIFTCHDIFTTAYYFNLSSKLINCSQLSHLSLCFTKVSILFFELQCKSPFRNPTCFFISIYVLLPTFSSNLLHSFSHPPYTCPHISPPTHSSHHHLPPTIPELQCQFIRQSGKQSQMSQRMMDEAGETKVRREWEENRRGWESTGGGDSKWNRERKGRG